MQNKCRTVHDDGFSTMGASVRERAAGNIKDKNSTWCVLFSPVFILKQYESVRKKLFSREPFTERHDLEVCLKMTFHSPSQGGGLWSPDCSGWNTLGVFCALWYQCWWLWEMSDPKWNSLLNSIYVCLGVLWGPQASQHTEKQIDAMDVSSWFCSTQLGAWNENE